MRIYLESAPTISEVPCCPECCLEQQPFAGDGRSWLTLGICRNCGHNIRSEFTQQLENYIEELNRPVPDGVEIVASWEGEPRLDMRFDKSVSPALLIRWLHEVGATIRMPAADFLGLLCHIRDERIGASRTFVDTQMKDEIDDLLVWIGQQKERSR